MLHPAATLFVVHDNDQARNQLLGELTLAAPGAKISGHGQWSDLPDLGDRPACIMVHPDRPIEKYEAIIASHRRAGHHGAFVFLLDRARVQDVAALLRTGVNGIVEADAGRSEIEAAIAAVNAGGVYVSKCFLPVLEGRGTQRQVRKPAYGLTDREREILSLVCVGLSSKEIARRLSLSVRTIDAHRLNIRKKTDARDRRSLILAAQAMGLFGHVDIEYPDAEREQSAGLHEE